MLMFCRAFVVFWCPGRWLTDMAIPLCFEIEVWPEIIPDGHFYDAIFVRENVLIFSIFGRSINLVTDSNGKIFSLIVMR